MRINIDQQSAQISVRGNSQARMQITTPKGQMSIRAETPKMEFSNTMPRFKSNRQRVNNESGLMSPLTLAKDFRNKGRRQALQAASDYKNDGNFIANPHIPGDKSIPMMSKNRMKRVLGPKEYNIGLMPSSLPTLEWDKGNTQINWSGHRLEVNWQGSNQANISVDTNYPVEVSLGRRPYFRVTSVEPAVTNRTLGRYIDRTV